MGTREGARKEVKLKLHLAGRIAALGILLSVSWGSRAAVPGQPSRMTTRALGREEVKPRGTSRCWSPRTFRKEEFGAGF